jgi:hypothetical protein
MLPSIALVIFIAVQSAKSIDKINGGFYAR